MDQAPRAADAMTAMATHGAGDALGAVEPWLSGEASEVYGRSAFAPINWRGWAKTAGRLTEEEARNHPQRNLITRVLTGEREQMRRLLGMLSNNPEVSPMLRKMIGAQGQMNSWGWVIGLSLLTPLFSLVVIYLNAGLTHGVALLLGQSKRGFPATFAACAYSCAPMVLMAVPACGSIVALVWLVVLTGIGMKETHRISTGGAAATVLAPYALFCCLLSVASAALMMTMRNAMGP